ncbi:MAG: hypothetical protein KatS3mg110_3106 [Pirellulaceae bacterium]|nr:MAG: hypothetical protein KatS3mg110_3106 [Pirellulaceae bacterium]
MRSGSRWGVPARESLRGTLGPGYAAPEWDGAVGLFNGRSVERGQGA